MASSNPWWICDIAVRIFRIEFFTIASIEATLGCIVVTTIELGNTMTNAISNVIWKLDIAVGIVLHFVQWWIIDVSLSFLFLLMWLMLFAVWQVYEFLVVGSLARCPMTNDLQWLKYDRCRLEPVGHHFFSGMVAVRTTNASKIRTMNNHYHKHHTIYQYVHQNSIDYKQWYPLLMQTDETRKFFIH